MLATSTASSSVNVSNGLGGNALCLDVRCLRHGVIS